MFKLLGTLVAALAVVGMPLFAVLGGVSLLSWLQSDEPDKRFVRYVAANVLDEVQHLDSVAEGAAMNGASLLVKFIVRRDISKQAVDSGLSDGNLRQSRIVQFVEGAAEHRALPAAGGESGLEVSGNHVVVR